MSNRLITLPVFILAVFLSACSVPDLNPDSIIQRVDSILIINETPADSQANVSGTIVPTGQPTLDTTGEALVLSETAIPTQPAGSVDLCDLASPGNPLDITIPDGTELMAGELFTKTWRLVNTGSCSWTQNYSIVWFSGVEMGTSRSVNLYKDVSPGEEIEISVDLVAPETAGIYQSNWKLQNEQGMLFGIGPKGDYPLWVKIQVVLGSTPTIIPVPSVTATPPVESFGEFNLEPRQTFDFDSGELSFDPSADLQLTLGQNGELIIETIYAAKMGIYGEDFPPNLDQCKSMGLDENTIQVSDLTSKYFCYRTNRGLPGYARILWVNENTSIVRFYFLTWTVP